MANALFTDEELKIFNYNDKSYIIEDKDFYEMSIEIGYMNVSLFCYYSDKKDKDKGVFVFDFIDKLKNYIVSLIIYKLATDYFNDDSKTLLLNSLKAFDSKRLMSGTIFEFLKKLKDESNYKKLYSKIIAKEAIVEDVVLPPAREEVEPVASSFIVVPEEVKPEIVPVVVPEEVVLPPAREEVEPEIVPSSSAVVKEVEPVAPSSVVVEEVVLPPPGPVDMAAHVARDEQLNRLIQLIKVYISNNAIRDEQRDKINEILALTKATNLPPIITAQLDIINHLSEIRASYAYKAHSFDYIDVEFKSADFENAKSNISHCLQYFKPVIEYILNLSENDKLNNICIFLLMLLDYDYNSIKGKKRPLDSNDDGKYLDFLKKISEAQTEKISSDTDVANIIIYVSYYLFEIYNEVPIPFARFSGISDIQITGGDGDAKTNNLINMIILNTLNSILLFNDKQLIEFITNVNEFNKKIK